jgi:demethylmenaquinone methyltransferase/2-methoxy-6-polyprenyl-1,4-benzoquinol methylase
MKRSPAEEPASAGSGSGPFDPVPAEVLDEQLAYYGARAPEYDRWFLREGRYDRGPASTQAWRRELGEVQQLLDGICLDGQDVLELAAGTGLWTRALLERGATVTAIDASPKMLAELATRLGNAALSVIVADLFSWVPPRRFDAVVSCFFMSHVPDERFDGFAELIAASLHAGGTVFLVDSQRVDTSTAADHVLPSGQDQTMRRHLDDGRTFTIVKRFRDDAELVDALAARGVNAEVHRTPTYFQVVTGTRT